MLNELLDLDSLKPEALGALRGTLAVQQDKIKQTRSLAEFVRAGWPILEPTTPLVWNWHLDVMAAYLEAVYPQRIINRLIINVPPGAMKSLMVSVFFPTWIWAQNPSFRFLIGSNEGTLATRDALKMRQLIESDWFRAYWPEIQLSREQSEKGLFANTKRGHRESQGVRAAVTGKRANMLIWDDPHDAKKAESDIQRNEIIDAWDSAWSSRLNQPNEDPVIVIMQRVHFGDITGHLMSKENQRWVLLRIPMMYDADLTYNPADINRPDLADPRTTDGELLFPQRYNAETVKALQEDLGPYGTAGQHQQTPSPRGGGELKPEWLEYYDTKPTKRDVNTVILVDPSGERKPGQSGPRDNSAMGVIGIGEDNNYYLLDGVRSRMNIEERVALLFKWHRQYRPRAVGYESYGMQNDISYINLRMELDQYRFKIIELGGSQRKTDRIRRLIPALFNGRWWFPREMWRTDHNGKTVDIIEQIREIEMKPFPVGKEDDFLDMLSRTEDEEIKKKLVPPSLSRPKLGMVREFRMRDRAVGY